jgi:hypothetical protein
LLALRTRPLLATYDANALALAFKRLTIRDATLVNDIGNML